MREIDTAIVRSALLSPAGRKAVGDKNIGDVVRIVRKALDRSQSDVARLAGYSQATISRLENGATRISHDADAVRDIGAALGIPPDVLGMSAEQDGDDDVRRRDFLTGALSVSAMALLPKSIVDAGHVGAGDIAEGWRSLRRMVELGDSVGGAECYPLSVDMSRRLQSALNLAHFSPGTEKDLQSLTAAVMEQTGWVAYDGGRDDDARRWWLEAISLAEIAGATDVRTTALSVMSLQTSTDATKAKETLSLVQRARGPLNNGTDSVALSMLAAREAVARSQLGDGYAATAAISTAKELLARGRTGHEPAAWGFWGMADLAAIESRVAMYQRDGRRAERSAREALAHVDPVAFARNSVGYSVRLGNVLAMTRQFDEAIAVTSEAVAKFGSVRGSRKTASKLTQTLDTLRSSGYRPAQEFSDTARKVLGRGDQ